MSQHYSTDGKGETQCYQAMGGAATVVSSALAIAKLKLP